MTDDFSLASPAGHLIMGDGSGPDGLATKDGAKALSRAGSVDTATTQLNTPSRTKNLIIEWIRRESLTSMGTPALCWHSSWMTRLIPSNSWRPRTSKG